jgi:hypothetical protein
MEDVGQGVGADTEEKAYSGTLPQVEAIRLTNEFLPRLACMEPEDALVAASFVLQVLEERWPDLEDGLEGVVKMARSATKRIVTLHYAN